MSENDTAAHIQIFDAMRASCAGGNAQISLGERPNGDFPGESIPTPHPAASSAKRVLPCGLNSIATFGN